MHLLDKFFKNVRQSVKRAERDLLPSTRRTRIIPRDVIGQQFLTALAGKGDLLEFRQVYDGDNSLINVKNNQGRAPVHEAAVKGRLSVLEFICRNGGDVNLQDNDGNTALHLAVMASNTDIITFLLQHGADSTVLNIRSMAPIHLAAEGGHYKSLETLVKNKDVDVNLRGEQGGTALHFSALMNSGECARLLSKSGALPNMKCDNGFYPIHAAAKSASSATLLVLIQEAIKRGYKRSEILSFTDIENNTPIHSAVHSGNLKVVEVCLQAGSSLTVRHQIDESTPVHFAACQGNLRMLRMMYDMQPVNFARALAIHDVNQMTPLHSAAIFDHVAAVEFLIEKGADLNARDKEERTPLLLAASKGAWSTVKCLLSNDADIWATDLHKRNFLHLAMMFGGKLEELGCNLLKGVGKYVDVRDEEGCTPLHLACREGNSPGMENLLGLGANIAPKNNLKQSPFHYAAKHGRLSICRRLLESESGCSIINETDTHGQTALHMAAENGHTHVVTSLLQQGAVTGRDHDSNTALHLAASNGYTQCMRLLLGVHSNLLDVANNDGDTALHLAALHGHTNAVTLLMSRGAGFIQNNEGLNFFDNAIKHARADVAMGIVVHERWEEAMDLSSTLYGCPMVGLVRTLPEVCMVVLERSQTMSPLDPRHRKFYIDYNFKYLRSAMKPLLAARHSGSTEFKPMPELNMMVKAGRVECLSHPVCTNFLRMKWHSYGRWYCSIYLLIYLTFLALLTTFVVTNDSMDHYDQGKVDNATIEALHGNHLGGHYYSPVYMVFLWLIEVYAGLNIVKEIVQMFTERWRYFTDCQNLLEWLLYVLVLLFVSPFLAHYSTHWQWEIGAFAVFLAWFNCLVFLQRFDFFGLYVVMFVEILKTLLQVIAVFSILIVAFGLTFFILMSHETSRAYFTPGLAMLRVVTMMQEMEYMDTYNEPYTDDSVVTLHYAHGTLFFITIYVLFMPIILMNLLIGLAVGDIQSVLTNARLQRLTLQVNLHTSLERRMPRDLLLKLDKHTYRVYPNRRRVLLSNIWSQMMSYDDEVSGMMEGQTAAHNKYIYTELYKQKHRLKQLSDTMEKTHSMLVQISRSMDIPSAEGFDPKDKLHSNPQPSGLEPASSSLGRQMLQQSMIAARWRRYVQGGQGRGGRGRGRGGRR